MPRLPKIVHDIWRQLRQRWRGRSRLFCPWITCVAVTACVTIYVGLNRETNPATWGALSAWGALPADRIWSGAYWGLLTCTAVHLELWHLAFNVGCLWMLGTRLEYAIGSLRYLLLIVASAFVASAGQLAVSGTTGIGASGIGYAIFGFMLVLRDRYPGFREVLTPGLVKLFIVWLFGCMLVTYLDILHVANTAHVCGMLFGSGVAGCLVLKYRPALLAAGLTALVVAALLPLFWCPWSKTWLGLQAEQAYAAGDHERAIAYLDRVIAKDAGAAWAYQNRGVSYWAIGERQKAVADFATASRLNPQSSSPEKKADGEGTQ